MRLLCYTSPARGHLYPVAPILLRLQERGHEVAVWTLSSAVPEIRGAGLRAEPMDARIEACVLDDHRARTSMGRIRRALRVFGARARSEVTDVGQAIAAIRPDALLIDCNAWGASAVAEASGLPWAAWIPYPVPLPRPGVPPFGPGLAPMAGPLGRLRDRSMRALLIDPVLAGTRDALDEVRAEVGLPSVASLADLYWRAPLTLYLTAEPFEYSGGGWPASYRLVGPVNWDPPHRPPPWLDGLDGPIVVVTTSSEPQQDAALVRTAMAAHRDGTSLVVTMPAGAPPDLDVPAGVRVVDFVPHSLLLPRATCMITAGGMGATQKALSAGVPVVVVPFGRDQFEVARRVEVCGAGVRLPAGKLNPDRLARAMGRARRKRPAAQRVAQAFARAGGAARAAAEIEHLWTSRTGG